jgi:DNA-binding NarL/FixJ family response regulator
MVGESSEPEPDRNRHALLGVQCLLVEDDTHVSALEKRILQRAGAIVDGAGTVAEALSALELRAYDLLVVDLGLPDGCGATIVQRASRLRERPAILVVSGRVDLLTPQLAQGADLITTKGELSLYLVGVARAALATVGRLIPRGQANRTQEDGALRLSMFADARKLTRRQRQVLALLAAGIGPKEVSARLGISASTVRFHACALYRKCAAGNQREALAVFGRAMAGIADKDALALSVSDVEGGDSLPTSPSHGCGGRLG